MEKALLNSGSEISQEQIILKKEWQAPPIPWGAIVFLLACPTEVSLPGITLPLPLPKHQWRTVPFSRRLERNERLQLRVLFIFDHSGSVQSSSVSIPVCVIHVEREHLVFMLSVMNYKCNSGSFLNTFCKCSQRLLSDWCTQ